ncbi:MAG TPA: hypothetical protein VGL42_17800 [Opitutaceae bacterium]|jgi:hypothetical protein
MKKKLYIALGVLAALAVAAYLAVIFFVGSFVVSAVNRFGPPITKTSVTLTAAHISPLSGVGDLDILVVGNPPGWSAKDAVTFKKIHVSVVPSSLFSNHVIIRELEIDGPVFDYETKFVSSNIGQLLNNIQGQKGNDAAQAKTKSGETMRFEIDHLLVKDGQIHLGVAGLQEVTLSMPPIDYHNLGKGTGGVTSTELAELLGSTMLTDIVKTSSSAIGKVVPAGSDVLKNAGSALKSLFGH